MMAFSNKIFTIICFLSLYHITSAQCNVQTCKFPLTCVGGQCMYANQFPKQNMFPKQKMFPKQNMFPGQQMFAKCDRGEEPCGMMCCDQSQPCNKQTMMCAMKMKYNRCDASERRCGTGLTASCCGKDDVCELTPYPYCRKAKVCDGSESICGRGLYAQCCKRSQTCIKTGQQPWCKENMICDAAETQCGHMCCDRKDKCDMTEPAFPQCQKAMICDASETPCGLRCCDRDSMCNTQGEIPYCKKLYVCDTKEIKCGNMCCEESEYCDKTTTPGVPMCKYSMVCDNAESRCGAFCCDRKETCDARTDPDMPRCVKPLECFLSTQCGNRCCDSNEQCDRQDPQMPYCIKLKTCDFNEEHCGRSCCKRPMHCDRSNIDNPRCEHSIMCQIGSTQCGSMCCNAEERCDRTTFSNSAYCRPTIACGQNKFQCGQNCCSQGIQTCDRNAPGGPVCVRIPDRPHYWLKAIARSPGVTGCLASEFKCQGSTGIGECCKYGSSCAKEGKCIYTNVAKATCTAGSQACGQSCCSKLTHDCAIIPPTNAKRCVPKEQTPYIDGIYHPFCSPYQSVCGTHCCKYDEACVKTMFGGLKCVDETPKYGYQVVKEAIMCELSHGVRASKCNGICCPNGHFCVKMFSEFHCVEYQATFLPMPATVANHPHTGHTEAGSHFQAGSANQFPVADPALDPAYQAQIIRGRLGAAQVCNHSGRSACGTGCCPINTNCASASTGKKVCVGLPVIDTPHPFAHQPATNAWHTSNSATKTAAQTNTVPAPKAVVAPKAPPAPKTAPTVPAVPAPAQPSGPEPVKFAMSFASFPSPYCATYVIQMQHAFRSALMQTEIIPTSFKVSPGAGCLPPLPVNPRYQNNAQPQWPNGRRLLQASNVQFVFSVVVEGGINGRMAVANAVMSDDFAGILNTALESGGIRSAGCNKATAIFNMPVVCDSSEMLCAMRCCKAGMVCYQGSTCLNPSQVPYIPPAPAASAQTHSNQAPQPPQSSVYKPQQPSHITPVANTKQTPPQSAPQRTPYNYPPQHPAQGAATGGTPDGRVYHSVYGTTFTEVPESMANPDPSGMQNAYSCGFPKKMPCGRQCCDRHKFGQSFSEVKKCMKVASPQMPVMYRCMKMERLVEYGVPFQQRGYNAYGMKLGQMAPIAAQCDGGEQACGPLCCDSSEICNPTTFQCTGGAPITPFKLKQTRGNSGASTVFRNVVIGGVGLLGAIVLGIVFYKRKYEPQGGRYSLMLDGVQTRE